MKVIFRLNANNQYLAFFLKNGELTQYSGSQENSCSAGFFQRTLHLTDLNRVSNSFKEFLSEVRQWLTVTKFSSEPKEFQGFRLTIRTMCVRIRLLSAATG
mgnify:CR=1 FL=1